MNSHKHTKEKIGQKIKCQCFEEGWISLEDNRYYINCTACGNHSLLKTMHNSITKTIYIIENGSIIDQIKE